MGYGPGTVSETIVDPALLTIALVRRVEARSWRVERRTDDRRGVQLISGSPTDTEWRKERSSSPSSVRERAPPEGGVRRGASWA